MLNVSMPIRGNIHFHRIVRKVSCLQLWYQCPSGAIFIFIIYLNNRASIEEGVSMPIRGNIHFHNFPIQWKSKIRSINAHQGQYSFS